MSQYASYTGYLGGTAGAGGITTINGENGPAISISAGPGISISTLSDNITISNTSATTLAPTYYVDPEAGTDSPTGGSISQPFKTLKYAQATIPAPTAAAMAKFLIFPGTCNEDPSYSPNPFIILCGSGRDITVIQHSDSSGISISYGGSTNFVSEFKDFTVLGLLSITRQAAQSVASTQFLFNNCNLADGCTMTGSGAVGKSDALTIFNSFHSGINTITANATFLNLNMVSLTGDATITGVGVDATSAVNMNHNFIAGQMRFLAISNVNTVNAFNFKNNRITLTGVNAFYNGNAGSFAAGNATNWLVLASSATASQIGQTTIKKRLRVPTKVVTTGSNTPDAFVDEIVKVNKTVAGASTITMPTMTAGNMSEGIFLSVYDSKGDAVTNNTTVGAGSGATFSNGATTDLIKFNNCRHDYQFSGTVWELGPVSRMGDSMFGELDIIALNLKPANFNSNFWGNNQYGVVVDSTLFHELDVNNSAMVFASTDLSSNEAFIPPDIGIQTGSNLGNNLSLSGTHATGNIWIHTGDIPNDASGNNYKPGAIRIVSGLNTPAGISGGVEINSCGISDATPTSNQVLVRTGSMAVVDSPTAGVTTLSIDTATPKLDMHSHPIVNVQDPSSAQDAATKAYVDAASPSQATMWVDEGTILVGNGQTIGIFSPQAYNIIPYQNPPANADSISWGINLKAGTYTFYQLGSVADNRGTIDWYLDGGLIAAGTGQDWYNVSVAYNDIRSFALVIPTSGFHTLKFIVNGKNGASTDYFVGLTKLWVK